MSQPPDVASDDSSQTVVAAVVTHVLTRLPTLFDHGFTVGDTVVPPLGALDIPPQLAIDPGVPLPLCPLMFEPAPGTGTTIDLTEIRATGIDTIAPAGPVTFRDGDATARVPVWFAALTLTLTWTTHSLCVRATGDGDPAQRPASDQPSGQLATDHAGTLAVRFTDVTVILTVALSPAPLQVRSIELAIVDDPSWRAQPVIAPARDITYDDTMSPAQITLLDDVLASGVLAAIFRRHAQTALEQPGVTTRITRMLDQGLAALAGTEELR